MITSLVNHSISVINILIMIGTVKFSGDQYVVHHRDSIFIFPCSLSWTDRNLIINLQETLWRKRQRLVANPTLFPQKKFTVSVFYAINIFITTSIISNRQTLIVGRKIPHFFWFCLPCFLFTMIWNKKQNN